MGNNKKHMLMYKNQLFMILIIGLAVGSIYADDYAVCPKGQYCNQKNFCSTSKAAKKNHQLQYSNAFGCRGPHIPCKQSTNKRCGPDFGNQVCPRGQYCGSSNWCGNQFGDMFTQQIKFSNGYGCYKQECNYSTDGRCGKFKFFQHRRRLDQ